LYANTWTPGQPPTPHEGDASLWLDHLKYLITRKEEREHILKWMAYTVQHPDEKINHALLVAGRSRNGKDALFEPFKAALGRSNVSEVDAYVLTEPYQDFMVSKKLLVFQEVMNFERVSISNRLKPIIAAPPEELVLRRLGQSGLRTPNLVQALFFSNHRDAINVAKGDRRYFAVWCDAQLQPPEYYSKLFNWYTKHSGFNIVHDYLLHYDTKQFSPGEAPPVTQFLKEIQQDSMTSVEMELEQLIEAHSPPFRRDIIEMRKALEDIYLLYPTLKHISMKQLHKTLKHLVGLTDDRTRRYRVPDSPTNARRKLYCIRNYDEKWGQRRKRPLDWWEESQRPLAPTPNGA